MDTKSEKFEPVAPGGTIGILGGGQLGRMLALAAARLGLKAHVFSDEVEAPAFQVAAERTHAAYDDRKALMDFAGVCDAVTFEFENVPAETVDLVATRSPTRPDSSVLRTTQDRLIEKNFVASLGIATPKYRAANSARDAREAFADLRTERAVLKTCRMGYDGKGQAIVASIDDAARAFESFGGAAAILEEFVDFDFEASVVAARARDGVFAAYDPPENIHGEHILRRSIVPGRLSRSVSGDAIEITRSIAHALNYVGVLAVEFFVGRNGALLVNEIAPRVHNSGHWTIEACVVSQFEQHIRAVAGWPLGDPNRHSDAVMENIIGQDAENWTAFAARGGGLHLYGKPEIRAGRKMGHITTLSPKTGT